MKSCYRMYCICALAMLVFVACAPACFGAEVYVKWDSPGTGSPPTYDGQSWETAFHEVQDGIDLADSGDQVWVAGDSEHPYVERVTLKDGVALYGGFDGSETAIGQRDWEANVTILDGNQGGSVVSILSCSSTLTQVDGFTIRNGYSLSGGGVYCVDSRATISHNTITNNEAYYGGGGIYCAGDPYLGCDAVIQGNQIGGADSAGNTAAYGGGIYCTGCSPTIEDNTIEGNSATVANSSFAGGGICCETESYPQILHNRILYNEATGWNTGGGGIGVYESVAGGHPYRIHGNSILHNIAFSWGGGISYVPNSYYETSNLEIDSNDIEFNVSLCLGGGMQLLNPRGLRVTNNLFLGNEAGQGYGTYGGGGALVIADGLSVFVGNNTFVANDITFAGRTEQHGGAILVNLMDGYGVKEAVISNNVFMDNTSPDSVGKSVYVNGTEGTVWIRNCCAYNTGEDNDADQLHYYAADEVEDCLYINPLLDEEYHLDSNSPCIDTGTSTDAPLFDMDEAPRPQAGHDDGIAAFDIGAYEFPNAGWPILLGAARSQNDGTTIDLTGAGADGVVVTAKFSDLSCLYVEEHDRSSGIRVAASSSDLDAVSVGDNARVIGTLHWLDNDAEGERYIQAQHVIFVDSAGELPELGMRHRDVGGNELDANNLGVCHARGPFNIGLLVTVSGMVTYRDDSDSPAFFYIWDGSNMVLPSQAPQPLDDGTGYRGLRIGHNGWLDDASRPVIPYVDWVTVNGIVTLKRVEVGEETISIPAVLPKTVTLNTSFLPIHADSGTALTAATNMFAVTNLPAATGPGIVAYDTWTASTAYDVGNVVVPTTPNTRRYACTVAGTSGATAPVWPSALGVTVVDGTVTWQNLGWDYNGDPNGPLAWECPHVMYPGDPDGRVSRIESANLSQYTYDTFGEPNGWFGGMLLGDGYWVLLGEEAWAVNYTGLDEEYPQWIATCEPGAWVLIGHPQDHETETPDIKMSDGGVVKSFFDASGWGAGWVQSIGFWWDNANQNQHDIGLPDDWPWTTTMLPWHGYTFQMNEDAPNRAWIIP